MGSQEKIPREIRMYAESNEAVTWKSVGYSQSSVRGHARALIV